MAKFIYHGPPQSIPMAKGKEQFEDLDLFPGRTTPDVDPKHELIASMIASGLLTEAPATTSGKAKGGKSDA